MNCKICGQKLDVLFKETVLSKYNVTYYKCSKCEFIQTEEPFWLDEAYGNAITDLDVGLVHRNIVYSEELDKILKNNFNYRGRFLDYAGGYGLFVRMMRDRGFDFYREDKYCKNTFAENYDLKDAVLKEDFEVVTAFEVFEHLPNPLEEIQKMFKYSNTVIFSTELHQNQDFKKSDDWWYFAPETGQHIAFYSDKTLRFIAKKFNLNYFSNESLHILSKKSFKKNPLIVKGDLNNVELKSLVPDDFEFTKNIIKEKKVNLDNQDNQVMDKKVDSKDDKAIKAAQLVRLNKELDSCKVYFYNIEKELNTTNSSLDKNREELDHVKSNLNKAQVQILDLNNLVVEKEIELNSKNEELQNKDEIINSKNEELQNKDEIINSKNEELTSVYFSREWRLISKIKKVFKKLFPIGSFRRKLFFLFFKVPKSMINLAFKIKNLFSKVYFKIKLSFSKSELKKQEKRKVNLKSKKIVCVGHSYHGKTKSNDFILEYLEEFFDVEIVLDESWLGKSAPDLSFIDESYLGVVFWQILPTKEELRKINNQNIIYFPMYDQFKTSGLGLEYWNNFKNVKVINFSKSAFNDFKKWGFDTMFIQYFPKPQEFSAGNVDEIFFWQRLTYININTLDKVLDNQKFKVHLHKTVDPHQEFIQPTKEQEKKYQITYSDWFDTREEMWDNCIKNKAIYVAPREYEGIGLGFLEAMAMGKLIIAIDNPTMNEYIENGKTGYLFDLRNPKKVNLENIRGIQKNTYEFIKKGYNDWENNKYKIIEFIKKN